MRNLTIKRHSFFIRRVDGLGNHYLHGREMVGIKAQWHVKQAIETLPQQSRTGQQYHGYCQFRDHHIRAESPPETAGGAAITVS